MRPRGWLERSRAWASARGDRVVIYMPMVPEALMAMMACARLGAIHSVVFGGFAANELASRIEDCRPKLIVRRRAGSSRPGSSSTGRCSTARSRSSGATIPAA